MNTTATEVLFDELLQRSDDLELFLTLHYGFQEVYENICLEFFFDGLIPRLQKEVSDYNKQYGRELKLIYHASDKRRDFLDRFGGLRIISTSNWPEKLEVVLQANVVGCNNMLACISLDDAEGDFGSMAGPFEQALREKFKFVKNYKKGLKFIQCNFPNCYWNSQDMFPALVKDVLAGRKSENEARPTVDKFVETLMIMVDIIDRVVLDTCACPAAG